MAGWSRSPVVLLVALTGVVVDAGTSICSHPTESEVTINDFDAAVTSTGSVPWLTGTFTGCSNARGDHNGDTDLVLDFHHDDGRNKGQVEGMHAPLRLLLTHPMRKSHPTADSACVLFSGSHGTVSQ